MRGIGGIEWMGLSMIQMGSNIDLDRMGVKKGLGLYCSNPSLLVLECMMS